MPATAFWFPKSGSSPAEWEDGFALSERKGTFAIADGASTSANARRWAALLTGAAVMDPIQAHDRPSFGRWLHKRCEEFASCRAIDMANTADQPWYATEVANRHAYATLLVLQFSPDLTTARALAVGDCLLVVVDTAGEALRTWPLTDAGQFGATPDLASSDPDSVERVAATARLERITVPQGCSVLLMTDALAQWALDTHVDEPRLWGLLAKIGHDDLGELVATLRTEGHIVNDDVTFVRVTPMNSPRTEPMT